MEAASFVFNLQVCPADETQQTENTQNSFFLALQMNEKQIENTRVLSESDLWLC